MSAALTFSDGQMIGQRHVELAEGTNFVRHLREIEAEGAAAGQSATGHH